MNLGFIFALLPALQVPQPVERLFVIEATALADQLHQVDPESGETLSSVSVPGVKQLQGIAHDGQWLLGTDVWPLLPSNTVEIIHPADAASLASYPTGQAWVLGQSGMDVHPSTGDIYMVQDSELYQFTPSSGQVSLVGGVSGLKLGEWLQALAIHPNGTAFASGFTGELYEVDLGTGLGLHLGAISPLSATAGWFHDLAFDSKGQLWGAYRPANPYNVSNPPGLYRIDHFALSAQYFPTSLQSSLLGIAFGPGTPETFYCTAKTGSAGCVPKIESAGLASPTATLGYEVSASGVRNNSIGVLLYTTNGPASNPFGGATMCIASPRRRTALVDSVGNPPPIQDCSGRWTYDLNTHFQGKPGPAAGDTVHCQWIGRDPGFPPAQAYALSDALEFTLLP